MKGKLLILEGGDGSGKSTQSHRLKRHLVSRGLDPLHVREPGSTPLGEEVRQILLHSTESGENAIAAETEMLLYMSCRAQLFKTVIGPSLSAGRSIILERSFFSTYAYQGGGLGIDGEMILQLGRWVCAGSEPDRCLILDLEVDQALARLGPSKDRIESRDIGFHERVRRAYLELAGRDPGLFRVVDAAGSVEEVEARIHAAVEDIF